MVPVVSFRCFVGFVAFVSVFRWFRFSVSVVSFRCFGGSGGFVPVFRVLVHAHRNRKCYFKFQNIPPSLRVDASKLKKIQSST